MTFHVISLFSKPLSHEATNPSVWPLRLPGLSSNTGSRGIQTTMPDQYNKDIPRDTALNVNIVLHGITAKLDIHCTNSGCEWKGTYKDHMEHSNKCRKLPMKCAIRMRGNNNQRRNCNPLWSGRETRDISSRLRERRGKRFNGKLRFFVLAQKNLLSA